MEERRILAVGLVCLDIVNNCEKYPREDEDVRAVSQRRQTGGNAANFLKVLAQLGKKCDFLGSLSCGNDSVFVLDDFKRRGIGTQGCVFHKDCGFPTSCVTISKTTGSRTIVHSRNGLPELTAEYFERIDLSKYCWIHFEGRNPSEILKMIKIVEAFNETLRPEENQIVISVEVEKKRSELMTVVSHADVVFISKDFAKFCGLTTALEALEHLYPKIKKSGILICAWGDQGASGVGMDKTFLHCNAFQPGKVIDTLGAGDTFIAGAVYILLQKKSVQEALTFACQLAGKKCGIEGFENLMKT